MKIVRNINLTNLPKQSNRESIDWSMTIGKTVDFQYDKIRGEITIIDYFKSKQSILVEYNHRQKETNISSFKNCCLGNVIREYAPYNYNVGDIISPNLEILEKLPYKKYKYRCLNDNYIGIISQSDLRQGVRCPVCTNKKVKIGINDMWTTNPELAKLLANPEDGYKYTQSSNKKVDWKCPDCGAILKDKIINNISKTRLFCYKCNDGVSYPNKIGFNFLNTFVDNIIAEYSPEWVNNYRYDFYFIYLNQEYILEMDGGFHFKDNNMSGQSEEQSKYIDNLKDMLAEKHGIKVIRIDCKETDLNYIKNNIMNSNLNKIFKLNKCFVDWEKINLISTKSLIKQSWDIYNSGITDIEDIHKIIKQVTSNTIYRYLLIGKKYKTCAYCPINKSRKVICLNDTKIFNTIQDAKEYYGLKSKTSICDCCTGKTKSTKRPNSKEKLCFVYYEDFINNTYISNVNYIPTKIVLQISLNGSILKEWNSIRDIGENTKFISSSVKSVCKGDTKTHIHKGYIWYYKEDYINQQECQKQGSLLLCSNQ